MDSILRTPKTLMKVALLLATATSLSVAAQAQPGRGFVLTAYSDAVGGERLLAGHYSAALVQIRGAKNGTAGTAVVQNDECVRGLRNSGEADRGPRCMRCRRCCSDVGTLACNGRRVEEPRRRRLVGCDCLLQPGNRALSVPPGRQLRGRPGGSTFAGTPIRLCRQKHRGIQTGAGHRGAIGSQCAAHGRLTGARSCGSPPDGLN